MSFQVIATPMEGLLVLEPTMHEDGRGRFFEAYERRAMQELGIPEFVQENQSLSRKGVLRGLHFQRRKPQGKLVRVLRGRAFDVAVDLRPGPTFGRWHGELLTEERGRMFFLPAGFAHGFVALTDGVELLYQCTDYYDPSDEGNIAWNDPDLAIVWQGVAGKYRGTAAGEGYALPDGTGLILSEKDARAPRWREL